MPVSKITEVSKDYVDDWEGFGRLVKVTMSGKNPTRYFELPLFTEDSDVCGHIYATGGLKVKVLEIKDLK